MMTKFTLPVCFPSPTTTLRLSSEHAPWQSHGRTLAARRTSRRGCTTTSSSSCTPGTVTRDCTAYVVVPRELRVDHDFGHRDDSEADESNSESFHPCHSTVTPPRQRLCLRLGAVHVCASALFRHGVTSS
eukprot:2805828-Rhodomonas_salina.4